MTWRAPSSIRRSSANSNSARWWKLSIGGLSPPLSSILDTRYSSTSMGKRAQAQAQAQGLPSFVAYVCMYLIVRGMRARASTRTARRNCVVVPCCAVHVGSDRRQESRREPNQSVLLTVLSELSHGATFTTARAKHSLIATRLEKQTLSIGLPRWHCPRERETFHFFVSPRM